MVLLMGKGDLYPFSDYLKNYEEKSKGAVKPEIFNLISSQPLFFCYSDKSPKNKLIILWKVHKQSDILKLI